MTQHQAPEVTSELRECPFCGEAAEIERIGDRRQSTIYRCTSCGCSLETGEEWGHGRAWNTRATQPLSLTVDEDLAQTVTAWRDHFAPDGKRIRLDPANKESLHAVLGRVVAALGEQIAENANCSGDIDRSGLAQEVE